MNPSAALITSVALLSSCAAAPQQAWFHSSGRADQTQFQIDDGACVAQAYRAVGGPPAVASGGSSTTFSGQTSSGTTFQGQSQTVPTNQMFGAAAGFQAYDAEDRYNQAVNAVFRGCMAQRGWSLRNR